MRGTETKRREDTARRAPPGRCFPFYRAFPPAPRGACPHAAGWGRGAARASRSGGARELRGPRGPDKEARRAPGRDAKTPASARRGRRPRPPALTFEDRAELLQGHVPERPGASRGAEAAAARRRRRGAHGPARRQSRSAPIARHQAASPRGAGLRSCSAPCSSPPAGSRAARAPRRAPLLAPRRSVPSTAPQPRRAGARDCTRTGRSSRGRGASPSEVAGAGSPGSFKQGARAPRAGRAACALVPVPRPHPRPRPPPPPACPSHSPRQSPGPPSASHPGRAARPLPLGWGRGEEELGAAVPTPSAANRCSKRRAPGESPAHPPPLVGVRGELV